MYIDYVIKLISFILFNLCLVDAELLNQLDLLNDFLPYFIRLGEWAGAL